MCSSHKDLPTRENSYQSSQACSAPAYMAQVFSASIQQSCQPFASLISVFSPLGSLYHCIHATVPELSIEVTFPACRELPKATTKNHTVVALIECSPYARYCCRHFPLPTSTI